MKQSYFYLLIVVMNFHTIGQAQKDSNGIYLTQEDYKNGKLSYGAKCNDSCDKVQIKLTRFSSRYYIESQRYSPEPTQFVRLKRDQVFGYRTCEGTIYRFINHKDYEILEPREDMLFYRYRKKTPETKTETTNCAYQYGFTIATAVPIRDLTKSNPRILVADNYHQSFNTSFIKNTELYDNSEQKKFNINMLLKRK